MNLGSLTIAEVHVDRFGALAKRTFLLPDHPFVVFRGPNEAGKSTLAELIAWLIAGPGGDAANAQRFGSPGDRIGGHLTGTLRGLPFNATGNFAVLGRGAPNSSGLAVTYEGHHDAEAWRGVLGGLDPAVLAAIYRLWGEQLHHGDGVEEHLSRVALAGVSGITSPRKLIDDLVEDIRRLTTANGADADSVRSARRRIDPLEGELRAARTNASQHATGRAQLDQLESERTRLVIEVRTATEARATVHKVLEVAATDHQIHDLCSRLDTHPQVPDSWVLLIDDPTAVAEAVHALHDAGSALAAATEASSRACGDIGIPADRLMHLSIADGDLTDAARLVRDLERADDDLERADESAASAAIGLQHARSVTDRCLGPDADLPADRVGAERAALHHGIAAELGHHLDEWRRAITEHDTARRRATEARHSADEAGERLQFATEAWARRGTGGTAAAWMQRRISPVTPVPPAGRSATQLIVAGLVAAIAVIAAVVGEWVSAGVAAAVAAVVALLAVQSRHTAEPLEPDSGAVTDTFDAARDVLDAERRRDDAFAAAGRAAADAEAAASAAASHQDGVVERFRERGLPEPADPDHGHRSLTRWMEATLALAGERSAAEHDETSRAALAQARTAIRTIEAAGAAVLERWGAPPTTPLRSLEGVAGRLRSACEAVHLAQQTRERHHQCQSAFDRLVEPVADEIHGWRPARIVDHVAELARLDAARRVLVDQLQELERERQIRLGDGAAVQALLEAGLDPVDLERLASEHARTAEAADEQLRAVSEQIGALQQTIRELEHSERVAELSVRLGSEREHQRELAVEAAAHALAAQLLQTVADDYERTHQPRMVARAAQLARAVAPGWHDIVVRRNGGTALDVVVRQRNGAELSAKRLSTGARALLYLAFRLSLAEHDAERRGLRLPILCDDPLVHFDDTRAREVAPMLATAASDGHQVLLFTCHDRTVHAAREAGAEVVELDTT